MGKIVVHHLAAHVEHVAEQPGQAPGEPLARLDPHRLHHADQNPHNNIDQIIDNLPASHGRPFNVTAPGTMLAWSVCRSPK